MDKGDDFDGSACGKLLELRQKFTGIDVYALIAVTLVQRSGIKGNT